MMNRIKKYTNSHLFDVAFGPTILAFADVPLLLVILVIVIILIAWRMIRKAQKTKNSDERENHK